MVHGKTDLVLVAEIRGHARLETTRAGTARRPTRTRRTPSKLITVDC
ncbi:MAG TPA: hypothetical protein VFV66_08520 [Nonomuraea sp.]|nr:hypothetical protein [Nonomuraea sp.]